MKGIFGNKNYVGCRLNMIGCRKNLPIFFSDVGAAESKKYGQQIGPTFSRKLQNSDVGCIN